MINNNCNSTGRVTAFERDDHMDRPCSYRGENVFQKASMAVSEATPEDVKSTWGFRIKGILAR
jgi:hypothetical protein